MLVVAALVVGVPALTFCILVGYVVVVVMPGPIVDDDGNSYVEERAALDEKRSERPSPQRYEIETPPDGVSIVRFPSEGRELLGWYRAPAASDKPALVYLHGGFAFGGEDFTQLEPFLADGWAVFTPTWRGENGNAGSFEMFLGEVDDAANAVRWIAKQPGVSGDRVFVFGHSAGGILASLLSLVPDVPTRLTGSVGGLYHETFFTERADAPFGTTARESRRIRVLHPHVKHMIRPHVAWVGVDDGPVIDVARQLKAANIPDAKLTILEISGDHGSSLEPALSLFKAEAEATLRR